MISLFDLDDNSSDSEDDVDYVPESGQLSENEGSNEESLSTDDEKLLPPNALLDKKKCKKRKHTKNAEKKESVETKIETGTKGEKARADDVWKSFLEEVSEIPKAAETVTSSIPAVTSHEENDKLVPSTVKCNLPEKMPSQIFEFAGETISVANDGSIFPSAEDKDAVGENPVKKDAITQPEKRKGLQSVLGTIMNKKQKITTLQKTALDWKSYKKDEGIEAELEKFNKGKGGFIERQRFLQRSDVRSYEVERDTRLSKKPK